MVFYVMGGGYASAGMLIFGPISGLVLVPGLASWLACRRLDWNVYFSGILPARSAGCYSFWSCAAPLYGLAHPRYRKFYIPLVIILIAWIAINPYFWPGAAGGFEPADPTYLLSFLWGPVGLIRLNLLFQKRALKMTENSKIPTQFVGYVTVFVWPAHCLVDPVGKRLQNHAKVSFASSTFRKSI